MKKSAIAAALLSTGILLTSCGTTGTSIANTLLSGGQNNTTQTAINTGANLLDGLLSGVLNQQPMTQKELVGTWTFTGTDAVFESENLLSQAGGTFAATQLESQLDAQLAKFGIRKGTTTFVFNADNTFAAQINGKSFSGTYRLDEKNKTIALSAMMGLFTLTPKIARTTTGATLLFEADKLLSLVSATSKLAGKSSSQLALLSDLLNNYNGLRLGLQMKR